MNADLDGSADPEPNETRSPYRPNRAQWTLAGFIVAFVVGLVVVRLLKGAGLGQTAAFYIGLPTILALILTLSAPSGRILGMTLKATTILLLLAMPVLGEGFVCVIIAAPLFYAVAIVVALAVKYARGSSSGAAKAVVLPGVLLLLAAQGTEGTTAALTVPGDDVGTAVRVLAATPAEIDAALAQPLRFSETPLNGVLRLGFPQPLMDHGGTLTPGSHRVVMFDGAHHRPPLVAAHHWGENASAVEFVVTEKTPNSVRFEVVADHTPLATWLRWRSAQVSWRQIDAAHTELTWSLAYTRRLAPAWYFGPIERVVVGQAAGYLIDAIALPVPVRK